MYLGGLMIENLGRISSGFVLAVNYKLVIHNFNHDIHITD